MLDNKLESTLSAILGLVCNFANIIPYYHCINIPQFPTWRLDIKRTCRRENTSLHNITTVLNVGCIVNYN